MLILVSCGPIELQIRGCDTRALFKKAVYTSYPPEMRESSKKLSINRLNSRNLYLDQIRPHGLGLIFND